MRALVGRLFPPSCVLCGSCRAAGSAPVCPACWSRLPRAAPPRCPRCGAPGPRFPDGVRACGECLDWPSALARVRAPFLMEGSAARLVRALKYGGWTALSGRMGEAMAASARRAATAGAGAAVDLRLVPVPLSAARRRRRGFNQAGLLATALGRELDWPVADVLARRGAGQRQARLDRASRVENTRGAFRAARATTSGTGGGDSGDAPPALIVDDVVTTGSTAAACAAALRAAGWHPVGAVAFARAVGSRPGPSSGERPLPWDADPLRARPTSREG